MNAFLLGMNRVGWNRIKSNLIYYKKDERWNQQNIQNGSPAGAMQPRLLIKRKPCMRKTLRCAIRSGWYLTDARSGCIFLIWRERSRSHWVKFILSRQRLHLAERSPSWSSREKKWQAMRLLMRWRRERMSMWAFIWARSRRWMLVYWSQDHCPRGSMHMAIMHWRKNFRRMTRETQTGFIF